MRRRNDLRAETFDKSVSVIIPVKNRGALVHRAIASLRSQTFHDWQGVIVDDGSTDETLEVLENLSSEEPRVKVIRHAYSRGAQAARNTGIREASGSWIAFLDSDDWYLPESLETRLTKAINEGFSVVHSQCRVLRNSYQDAIALVPPMEGCIYRDVLMRPGPMFQGLMVHRQVLDEIGPLDETLVAYQEWDTSIRLARAFRFGFVVEPMFVYDRTVSTSISQNAANSAEGYRQVVAKHYREIKRVAGRTALAHHYLQLSLHYREARQWIQSSQFTARSASASPRPILGLAGQRIQRGLNEIRVRAEHRRRE